jgi:hypothetical protein
MPNQRSVQALLAFIIEGERRKMGLKFRSHTKNKKISFCGLFLKSSSKLFGS